MVAGRSLSLFLEKSREVRVVRERIDSGREEKELEERSRVSRWGKGIEEGKEEREF